ncbi:MAG: hypothetical protein M3250_05805 [Thermoproteota archaeon]|nr:hypothetical protein [Thermoproteota archaeon]
MSLRRSSRYELFFMDGHAEFYELQAATSSGSRWFYPKEFRSSIAAGLLCTQPHK